MLTNRKTLRALFISLFTLQFLLACTAQNIEGDQWIIFSAEYARENRFGSWLVADSGTLEYWSPTAADIHALEEGLIPYLQANQDRFYGVESTAWESLEKYNRQYLGLILNEKKTIYANFFCESTHTDWKKDFIFVLDGGACYFQFKYDPGTAEFFDLQVNGEG